MLNRVTLIGNLGKDPEMKRLEGGALVGKFSIATNEYYRDANNELQQQTEWHDVIVWRHLAEQAEKILKKGSLVFVDGKITHRKYTDKNGIERTITEVSATNFKVLDRKDTNHKEGGSYHGENPNPQRHQNDHTPDDGDMPF